MPQRQHIFSLTPSSLAQWCKDNNQPAFRAKQILEWVYKKGLADPHEMSNLPAALREQLADSFDFVTGATLLRQLATDGTRKLLVQWPDKRRSSATDSVSLPLNVLQHIEPDPKRQTECVMIPSDTRRTACISSQVGCPVGCTFCASGLGGLDGNLTTGQIVEQVWQLQRLIADEEGVPWGSPANPDGSGGGRITNIVFMGMGEPLANFANVIGAVRTIAADWGMGIGARKITISTVGLPQAINRLADELELPVTLALSLHAPNDELRRKLIPWASYTSVDELLAACHRWFKKTGREITLEYILLGGVNDQPEHADQLARVARSLRANVNLIRYNEVKGMPYARPETPDVRAFQAILRERKINAHIRASRGRDIAAACGQLRHEATPA